jgi:hypothetical protein
MKIQETVILILTMDEKAIFSKKKKELYHHFEHYRYLQQTNLDFKDLLLEYDMSGQRSEWSKKENDILGLLTMQNCVVFENGNTSEYEINNPSILYLPEGDLEEYQLQMIEMLIPQLKELPYLEVVKRDKEGILILNQLYQKRGPEILEDFISQTKNLKI